MADPLGAAEDRWRINLVVVERDGSVVLEAEPTRATVACPCCGTLSRRRHSSYVRRPLDLPWRGATVRLRIHSRRWFCDEPSCPRTIFAERFDGVLARSARRTDGVTQLLLSFALQAGGEGGARLARQAGLPVSPDTLLRLLRAAGEGVVPTPRVLGVDDLALRRRQRYATLFVDLETHRPIDLLADRSAEMLAAWLRAHPGVQILSRDRAEAYAEGGRLGAPGAVQVADRFHLLQNASYALDEVLRGRRRRIDYALTQVEPPRTAPSIPERPPSRARQQAEAARARRLARWQAVKDRRAAGQTISRIACELGMSRMTVRHLLATAEPPPRPKMPRPGGLRSPLLRPFVAYLQDRWQAGCTNIAQLAREIVALGYGGSLSLVRQSLLPWREPRPPGTQRRRGQPRTRRFHTRWLCLRPPEQLDQDEHAALEQLLRDDQELARGYALLQRFRQIIAAQQLAALRPWLADAAASDLPPFVSLAQGLEADRPAVEAALVLPWSNGCVEGHVHRVKLLKRAGYGRYSVQTLRARVLRRA